MLITPKRPLPKVLDKRQQKQQLQADVDAFLASGGTVTEVPKGQSGIAVDEFNRFPVNITNGSQQRTLVPDVVASIEQRKQIKKIPKTGSAKKHQTARKKWIYDDFGEPLRWVWAD
jgi:hypothetical protein